MQNPDALAVSEGRVVVGDWSADVGEVAAVSARLRGLLRDGSVSQAREMLSSLCRGRVWRPGNGSPRKPLTRQGRTGVPQRSTRTATTPSSPLVRSSFVPRPTTTAA